MKGTVRALFITPDKKAKPVAVASVDVIPTGFSGDYHARAKSLRQVLVLSSSILDSFKLQPGDVSENVVVQGIDVMALPPGQRVQMGNATFEVTIPCEPCLQMDRIRTGLRAELHNNRGMFVKVLTIGTIRVGDDVEVT